MKIIRNALTILVVVSINFTVHSQETKLQRIEPIEHCLPGEVLRRYYRDYDGDGYGNPFVWKDACNQPYRYVFNSRDCNDSDASVTTAKRWYPDIDGDGFGTSSRSILSCIQPSGSMVNNDDDCDDSDSSVHGPTAWYKDADKDGQGSSNVSPTYSCTNPTNSTYSYSLTDNDCDDTNPLVQAITWYLDTDEDGYGDPNDFEIQCSKPYGDYVRNSIDLCPDVSGTINGCPPAGADVAELWNTVQVTKYDRDGTIKGKSKSYYNDLGKPVQVQRLDIQTGKTWASQTLYDSYGRPALTTLSAPTNGDIPGDFLYRGDFIRKTDNTTFTAADFENISTDPAAVGHQSNSLGWYYSSANTSEPYQDITDRPYLRTIYSELNSGSVLRTIGGNKKAGAWKNASSFSMKAGKELAQAGAFNSSSYNSYKITKTVVRDVHGIENVVFTDTEAKTLATARSGGSTSRSMSVAIGKQGYVDIHVPSGSNAVGFSIYNPTGRIIKVYDLITEKLITASTSSLGNGFYRIAITNTEYYDPDVLAVTVSYKENYYDYSLNEYDKAGRLIRSYQPLDKLESTYQYNSLGQLVHTSSPDEGEAWFKYRADGQVRYSRNSKQLAAGDFSYTNYDDLGRPVESGVLHSNSFSTSNPDAALPSGVRSEQQFTVYDKLEQSDLNFLSGINASYASPSFLSGNVPKSRNANVTSYYSYDIYGRIEWMVQNINGLGAKTIDYSYDPVTGAVLLVDFQKYVPGERFVHRYSYDILGQLVKVETSTNANTFLTQATYEYYETGALKRKVLGDGLQGMDYVYNLKGALKSINHPGLTASQDPGGDSNDLFGMTLHYNSEDYHRNNTPKRVPVTTLGTEQYNGNIKGMQWKSTGRTAANYFYSYNRNNWLTRADFNLGQGTTDYRVDNLTYDANGNIKSLRRNKNYENGTNIMDNLTYRYTPGTNQLAYVDDAVTSSTNANDIKDQTAGNYTYNAIGELINNAQEETSYTYCTSGLVAGVEVGNIDVEFSYDDRGQRLKKVVTNGSITTTTFYVRDAAGNAIGIYTGNSLEHPVYGSSRIGVAKRTLGQTSLAQQNYFYELTDHLGNVRAVVQQNSSGNAVALVKTDYYPFGMPMPGRNMEGDYRYAYQGQEKDDETGMEAFELRLWDARIGRWLTVDPYGQFNSPYLGVGNNPISGIDIDGGWWEEFFNWTKGRGWNSNAAVEFQKSGGQLGEWVGDKFTGYRTGYFETGEQNGVGIAIFKAKQDYTFSLFGKEVDFFLEGNFRLSMGVQAGFDLNDFFSAEMDIGSVDIFAFSSMLNKGYRFGPKTNSVLEGHGKNDWQQSVGASFSGIGVRAFAKSEYTEGIQSVEFRNMWKERGIEVSLSQGAISERVIYTHDRLHGIHYLEARVGVEASVKAVIGIEGDANLVLRTKW